ncbi:MAG: glycosyltransferase family 4 protein [Anaerolineae bacterium]|nr:glycosyltransferase family 4 protein [Anaerolineae bacterium]MDW8071500.1 glycosyltransferase family 4 protein [Anaerolineae bacterium]
MRILISTEVFPPQLGDAVAYVPAVAQALAGRGHQVRVVTPVSDKSATALDQRYPFQVERLDLGRFWHWRVRLFLQLRWAEVVFVNGLLAEVSALNRLLRRPTVGRVTTDSVWEYVVDQGWTRDDCATFQRRRYHRAIERFRRWRNQTLRRMQALLVPCQSLGALVRSWGVSPERVRVLPDAFIPSAEAAVPWPGPDTPLRLITLGRLSAWQGVDELLAVLIAWDDVGLLVVGDGPQRAALEQLARRLRLEQRVRFVGWPERATWLGWMRGADLCVLNARHPGTPPGLLDAWAVGVPVLAAASGGVVERIRDGINGRLVPLGDRAALRDALRALLDDPLARASLRAGGLLSARQEAAFDTMIERLVGLLEEVAR